MSGPDTQDGCIQVFGIHAPLQLVPVLDSLDALIVELPLATSAQIRRRREMTVLGLVRLVW
jgi:hypothetical protein